MITNPQSGTNVHEIADGIYRINTPVDLPGGQAFTFNQYLVQDDEPLLFHTGPRQLFPLVSQAVAALMPVERLRWVGLSHTEADECGSMNQWLAAAPAAAPLCSGIAAMVSIGDLADRPPRALADGETLVIGRHTLKDTSTATFFCGDLFTQPGKGEQALTEADILGPSEAFRQPMDYYAHAPHTRAVLERLAGEKPRTLACMHGSAWRGDGGALLRHLSEAVCASQTVR